MLKFFRKIRKQLLSENRFSKYLLYAMGEIFLVVVGILIALQINNWNENRKVKAFELEMLRSFKQSLQTDLSDIDFNISLHKRGLKACDSILGFLESSVQMDEETLARLFSEAFYVSRFVYSTSAFESLKTQGVNVISDKALQKNIVDVYDSRYRFFAVSENDYLDYYWLGVEHIYPTRFKEGLKYDLDSPGYPGVLQPVDSDALKNDAEFIYYLKTFRNWTNIFINFHYKGLRSDVSALLDVIDKELAKREN